MIRELVLISADLAASPWFARGVPPSPSTPAGFAIETLAAGATAPFVDGPIPAAQAAQRFAEGDTCQIAFTSHRVMAAQMWCSEQTRFIDWIGCDIRVPAGHVHVYNSWVRPEFRGLGLQWALASASCGDVFARGRSKMCAGVERREYPPFARKYAAMGLGVVAPYQSLWSLRVLGVTVVSIPLSPPRSLESARENASRIFARRAARRDQAGANAPSADARQD
jgi:hypothetical protein